MKRNRGGRSASPLVYIIVFLLLASAFPGIKKLGIVLFWGIIAITAVILLSVLLSNRKKKKVEAEAKAREAEEARQKAEAEKIKYGPEIDPIIEEGNRALSEMGRLYMSIKDTEVRAKINELMRITDKITRDAIDDPADIPQIRKFMNYYLPTTIKLLNAYDRMSSQGIEGENLDKSMKNINEMLDAAIVAFKKRLDSLFENQALDIETDIAVMNQMLAREGLTDKKDFNI